MTSLSDTDRGHFLCKQCGAFFEAELGERRDRICPKCDLPVMGGRIHALGQAVAAETVESSTGPVVVEPQPRGTSKRVRRTRKRTSESTSQIHQDSNAGAEIRTTESLVGDPVKIHVRKGVRKIPYGRYFCFVLVWAVFVGGIAWFFRHKGGAGSTAGVEAATERTLREQEKLRRQKFVYDNIRDCQILLLKYFSTPVTSRTQFVKDAERVTTEMNRYYRDVYETVKPEGNLKLVASNLIDVGKQVAIETRWADEAGKAFEAVFFREKASWKLDWEHFVRSGYQPLITFRNRAPGARGVFRIALRERLASSRVSRDAFSFSICQPAIVGDVKDAREQAIATVPLDSEVARNYQLFVEKQEKGVTAFDSKVIGQDAGAFLRVQAELEVIELPGGKSGVKIVRLLRPHWLGTDLMGMDLSEAGD